MKVKSPCLILIGCLCAFLTVHSSFGQSLNYSGGTCVVYSIDIYLIGGPTCSNPAVSSPSSWTINPAPTTISYLNSNRTIRVTWNLAGSKSVYVSYSCPVGGSGGTTNPLNVTINSNVTPSVSLATNNPTLCQGSGSILLTATPTNGGGSPFYNFYVDGNSVYSGTNNSYNYSTSGLAAGNHTTHVTMSSSLPCVTSPIDSSSTLNFNVAVKATYTPAIHYPSQVCSFTPTVNLFVTVSGTYYNLTYL